MTDYMIRIEDENGKIKEILVESAKEAQKKIYECYDRLLKNSVKNNAPEMCL